MPHSLKCQNQSWNSVNVTATGSTQRIKTRNHDGLWLLFQRGRIFSNYWCHLPINKSCQNKHRHLSFPTERLQSHFLLVSEATARREGFHSGWADFMHEQFATGQPTSFHSRLSWYGNQFDCRVNNDLMYIWPVTTKYFCRSVPWQNSCGLDLHSFQSYPQDWCPLVRLACCQISSVQVPTGGQRWRE